MSRQITPLGWKIIEKLAEMKMTRREFCEKEGIPEYRLSNLMTGLRPAKKYREMVIKALGIEEE